MAPANIDQTHSHKTTTRTRRRTLLSPLHPKHLISHIHTTSSFLTLNTVRTSFSCVADGPRLRPDFSSGRDHGRNLLPRTALTPAGDPLPCRPQGHLHLPRDPSLSQKRRDDPSEGATMGVSTGIRTRLAQSLLRLHSAVSGLFSRIRRKEERSCPLPT